MVSSSAALVLALAGAAVALPTKGERFAARRARRALGQHKSNPIQRVEHVPGGGTQPTNSTGGNANVEYSSNWSGAVLSESAGTWTGISASFTVPTPSTPSGGSSSTEYSASAWVGIDGDTCSTAIWQTGVDFYVQGSSVSYDSWYEWYPDYANTFSGISFAAGDSVTLTITVTSSTSGTATIDNNSNGDSVSYTVTDGSGALCQQDAEWIVEDFEECTGSSCSLVPLADWGTVTFTDAVATSASGTTGPADATIIDLEQNGQVLTSVSVTDTTVTDEYTG